LEKRGLATTSMSGSSRFSTGRIVSAPSSMVSFRPRACSSRSVKKWPRSGIGRHLHFVDREERHRPVERHRFDGADEIARTRAARSSPRR
jgi:hypothetical protein